MAPILGKRKRVIAEQKPKENSLARNAAESSEEDNGQDLQDIFRRAFEAKFKPLASETKKTAQEQQDDLALSEEEADNDWAGLSSDDDSDIETTPQVQVIEHKTATLPSALSRAELKAFMSSKVPKSQTTTTSSSNASKATTGAADDEDASSEKLNLKHDLALHRLINESHLLHPSAAPSANHRQKLLDMRLQSLGSKTSILKQDKMPMAHRKGIVAKAADRETKRRQEAKENGIILEKATKVKGKGAAATGGAKRRERGVGGASVGSFKGGTLKLSKRDVADIKGRGRR